MSGVDYSEKIPNNVNLANDRTLQRALEHWQPHFRRSIGIWAGQPVTPEGNVISKEAYAKRLSGWVPSEADRAFVHSLMKRVVDSGKMAGWIAPPERGINNLPVEYQYVRLH